MRSGITPVPGRVLAGTVVLGAIGVSVYMFMKPDNILFWTLAPPPWKRAFLQSDIDCRAAMHDYYSTVTNRLALQKSYPQQVDEHGGIYAIDNLIAIGERYGSCFWYTIGLHTNDPKRTVLMVAPPGTFERGNNCARVLRGDGSIETERGLVWSWHRNRASWLFGTNVAGGGERMRERVKLFCGTNEIPIDWAR